LFGKLNPKLREHDGGRIAGVGKAKVSEDGLESRGNILNLL
jgi:hypothetical protein